MRDWLWIAVGSTLAFAFLAYAVHSDAFDKSKLKGCAQIEDMTGVQYVFVVVDPPGASHGAWGFLGGGR